MKPAKITEVTGCQGLRRRHVIMTHYRNSNYERDVRNVQRVTISRRGRSFGQHIQSNNESGKVVVSVYFRYNILQSILLKIKLQNEQQRIVNKQVYEYCKM